MKIITRNGSLNFKGRKTKNQCSKKGHEVYYYVIKLLFPNDIDYNDNGFIIDHDDINRVIQSIEIGSCERLADRIIKTVKELLRQKKITYIGFKISIQPEQYSNPSNSASFQQLECKNQMYLHILAAI